MRKLKRTLLMALAAVALAASPACQLTSKLGLPAAKSANAEPSRESGNDEASTKAPPVPKAAPGTDGDDLAKNLKTFEPEHGHQRVKAQSPPWCKASGVWERKERNAMALARRISVGFSDDNIVQIGQRLCVYPNDPVYKTQTGHVIQAWMNITGLKEKAAIAALSARMQPERWAAMRTKTCERYEKSDENIGFDKVRIEAMRSMFGCSYGNNPGWREGPSHRAVTFEKFLNHYDQQTEPPTEILRAYALLSCYPAHWNLEKPTEYNFASYAVCNFDGARANFKALEANLKAEKHNTYAVTIARESLANALLSERLIKAAIEANAKADEAYKEVFIVAPKRGWKMWNDRFAKHKTAFEAAFAMERRLFGKSRKAMRQCGELEQRGLATYMAGAGADDLEGAKRALGDAAGKVLLGAVLSCAAANHKQAEYYMLKKVYDAGQPARGPRRAAAMTAIEALGDVLADRPRFKVSTSAFDVKGNDELKFRVQNIMMGSKEPVILEDGSSIVKSVKSAKGGIVVTFKTKTFKEQVYNCKDTNKIWKIEGGRVIYHRSCRTVGTRTVKQTAAPLFIPEHAKAGIKAGTFLEFSGADARIHRGGTRPGYPRAVYASPKKKKLVAAFGYALN